MKSEVKKRIEISLIPLLEEVCGITGVEAFVEKPKVEEFGDYSTNLAMIYGKKSNMAPPVLAGKMKEELEKKDLDGFFEKIEIAGPGFLNLYLSSKTVWEFYEKRVLSGELLTFPPVDSPSVLLEFVSANPTGPLHIGHGRGAAIGDSLARILSKAGYRVQREYYINDVGNQIEVLGKSLYIRYLKELGQNVDLSDEYYKGEYLADLAREIVNSYGNSMVKQEEGNLEFFSNFAKDKILSGIKDDLSEFNVTIDEWFSEKSLHQSGDVEKTLKELEKRGYVYDKEGAKWFRSSEFGDDKDRVLVRANGQKTYFASDIAYHRNKIERGFGKLINIWGADHHGYVNRVESAMRAMGEESEALKVLLVQFVNLIKNGEAVSMSTRAGKFETLKDVVEEVGSDAARFFYLMRSHNSHLDFDLDLAKQASAENPVYYVQYAHARICSILREAREKGYSPEGLNSVSGLVNDEEIAIMKKALEFRETVRESARELEPHRIPFYLLELAKLFHSYYNKFRFISDDSDLSVKRISMAMGVKNVISTGLPMIGVTAPERM